MQKNPLARVAWSVVGELPVWGEDSRRFLSVSTLRKAPGHKKKFSDKKKDSLCLLRLALDGATANPSVR